MKKLQYLSKKKDSITWVTEQKIINTDDLSVMSLMSHDVLITVVKKIPFEYMSPVPAIFNLFHCTADPCLWRLLPLQWL